METQSQQENAITLAARIGALGEVLGKAPEWDGEPHPCPFAPEIIEGIDSRCPFTGEVL